MPNSARITTVISYSNFFAEEDNESQSWWSGNPNPGHSYSFTSTVTYSFVFTRFFQSPQGSRQFTVLSQRLTIAIYMVLEFPECFHGGDLESQQAHWGEVGIIFTRGVGS